jgi:hypothetical protein
VVFVVVTWLGIFLTRATVHSWFHRQQRANQMVGLALSSYFVLFGLLPGLASVATYQNYSNLGDIVDKRASRRIVSVICDSRWRFCCILDNIGDVGRVTRFERSTLGLL